MLLPSTKMNPTYHLVRRAMLTDFRTVREHEAHHVGAFARQGKGVPERAVGGDLHRLSVAGEPLELSGSDVPRIRNTPGRDRPSRS